MKSRKSFIAALIAIAFASLSFVAPLNVNGSFKVDTNSSNVKWTGRKVTGEHFGKIAIKSGALEVKDGKLTGGTFDIDMTSITCEDLEGEWNQKLVGHLKSDDFFGVEKYPTSTLKIKSAVHQGKDDYKIVADLTIKGITKEIKFPAKVDISDKEAKATAEITVDRSEYNVRYGSGSFFDDLGDKTIYDNFDLNVELVTKL